MRNADFRDLVESIRQAGEIHRGELEASRRFDFLPVDIKAIRARLDLSQSEFAFLIGVSVATLRNWEQGRRRPEGPARALLKVVEERPDAVLEALASQS
jgi:putative transcriptional regulator